MFDALSDSRLIASAAVLASYVSLSAYWLRPLWRRKSTTVMDVGTTLVAYATQTGYAQQVAEQTAQSLRSAGQSVHVASLAQLTPSALQSAQRALFVVSTTGEGDPPDPAAVFVRDVLSTTAQLPQLEYGVLALGDREYHNFCAFGHRLDAWLKHQGARSLFDLVEVDNGDEGALRHWQHNLSLVFDAPDLPDWESPTYERWRLTNRTLLNPGSAGDPCYLIELAPTEARADWHAGDIAEIDPFNSHRDGGEKHPHREYSIASIPSDGVLQLVVRQMRRPSGELGLGSGWLTETAPLASEVSLRVRANPNFRLPDADAPLILIGNGTGIAGLRALLKSRIAREQHRNWLIFGERNAAHDAFFDIELRAWEKAGALRVDRVYSRDQFERRYVQHRVRECADAIREWLASGAYVYVCGSLAGMAPGVHGALVDMLGEAALESLTVEGRYRRDVY